MTEVSISQRAITVFSRFAEVKYYQMLKDLKKVKKEDVSSWLRRNEGSLDRALTIGKWNLQMSMTLPFHDCSCDEEDNDLIYGEECKNLECDAFSSIIIKLNYLSETIFDNFCLLEEEFEKTNIVEWFKSLETNFKVCKCNKKTFKEDKCENCYIHSYIRTEEEGGDCCICKENDDCWVKLIDCGHILHKHCYNKIKERKCPLCRQLNSKVEYDCYDV